jgi:hypothetical protein
MGFCLWPVASLTVLIGLISIRRKKKVGWAALLSSFALFALAALPWYAKAVTRFAKSSCIANIRAIEGAKATWALENKKENSDVPKDSELFGETAYIREKPECPRGGIYTVGPVGERPTCSLGVTNEIHRLQ